MEHVWERGLFDKLLDWGDTPSYFGVLGVFGVEEAHHPRDFMFKSDGSMINVWMQFIRLFDGGSTIVDVTVYPRLW